jgi:hypothetical protein
MSEYKKEAEKNYLRLITGYLQKKTGYYVSDVIAFNDENGTACVRATFTDSSKTTPLIFSAETDYADLMTEIYLNPEVCDLINGYYAESMAEIREDEVDVEVKSNDGDEIYRSQLNEYVRQLMNEVLSEKVEKYSKL